MANSIAARLKGLAFVLCAGTLISAGPASANLKLAFSGEVRQATKNNGGGGNSDTCTYNFQVEELGGQYFLTWQNEGCRNVRTKRGADGSQVAVIFNSGQPQRYSCKTSGGARRCSDGRQFRMKRNTSTSTEERNVAKRSSKALSLTGKTNTVIIRDNAEVRDFARALQLKISFTSSGCKVDKFSIKDVTKIRSSKQGQQVKYKRGKGSGWTWTQDLRKGGSCKVLSR